MRHKQQGGATRSWWILRVELLVEPGRSDGSTQARAVAEINVQTCQWLQVASVDQAACIDGVPSHALGQRNSGLLGTFIVTSDKHAAALVVGELRAVSEHLSKQCVECLDDVSLWHCFGNFFGSAGHMANGQGHVVGAQEGW